MRNAQTHPNPAATRRRAALSTGLIGLGLAAAFLAAPIEAHAHEPVQPTRASTSTVSYSWHTAYHWENTSRYVYKYDRSTGKVWVFVKQRDGSYRLCSVRYCIPWCAVPAKNPVPNDNIEPFSVPTTQI